MKSTKSDFNVEVVKIGEVQNHPNADRLELARVAGFTVVVRKGEFQAGELAVHVPVGALVPLEHPAFSFLSSPRIKAARLRGIYSEGLLVPMSAVPELGHVREGDDVRAELRIEKHLTEEEKKEERAVALLARRGISSKVMPVYGLDSLRRFPDAIKPGTEVVLTAKIDGSNGRFVHSGGKFYVGSHRVIRSATKTFWEKLFSGQLFKELLRRLRGKKSNRRMTGEVPDDLWHNVAEKYDLENKLAKFPDMVVFGEVYGKRIQVRGGKPMSYDSPDGVSFRVFDVFDKKTGTYLSYNEMVEFATRLGLKTVVELAQGQWPLDVDYSVGPDPLNPGHIREGYVVRTDVFERDRNRVILKNVSEDFKILASK